MSGGAMGPNVNRLLLARPQQPGHIVLARNGVSGVNGTAIRQQQVLKLFFNVDTPVVCVLSLFFVF